MLLRVDAYLHRSSRPRAEWTVQLASYLFKLTECILSSLPYRDVVIPHPKKIVLQFRTQSAPLSITIIVLSAQIRRAKQPLMWPQTSPLLHYVHKSYFCKRYWPQGGLLPPFACKQEPGRLVPPSKSCQTAQKKNWLHSSCSFQVLIPNLCLRATYTIWAQSFKFNNLVHVSPSSSPLLLPHALFLAALPIFLAGTAPPPPTVILNKTTLID